MALCRAIKDYLKEGGATSYEIDDFLDFCSMLKLHATSVTALSKTTSLSPNSIQET